MSDVVPGDTMNEYEKAARRRAAARRLKNQRRFEWAVKGPGKSGPMVVKQASDLTAVERAKYGL